jgi:tetratricopeptide (TPR) repeat protein
VYANLGEVEMSREYVKRAYELRDRVSEPERLYILTRYYTTVEDATQKALDTYDVWIQTYPKDYVARVNLSNIYQNRGEDDKAVETLRAAIALAPDQPLPYGNLAGSYMSLGKLDQAQSTLEDAVKRGLDSFGFRSELYVLAFLRRDEADMTRQAAAARKFPEGFRLLTTQAELALHAGQLGRAKDLIAQFTGEASSRMGLKGSAASAWNDLAQASAFYGDARSAHDAVQHSLALERTLTTLVNASFAMLSCGDLPAARKMLDEAKRMPGASAETFQAGFTLLAAIIRVQEGDLAPLPNVRLPNEDTDNGVQFARGYVDLKRGDTQGAAATFKRMVDRHGAVTISYFAPLSRVYYARALAKLGKPDDSRREYERAFDIWKGADPDLPILVAAKKEYAALR